MKKNFPDFWRFFWDFFEKISDFGQKSIFLPLFTTKYKLIEILYYHNIFSRTNNNVKEMFEILWNKKFGQKNFSRNFWKQIFIDFELFSIFTQMTIEISDPISTFKGSNRLNIVPKLPKMSFLNSIKCFQTSEHVGNGRRSHRNCIQCFKCKKYEKTS